MSIRLFHSKIVIEKGETLLSREFNPVHHRRSMSSLKALSVSVVGSLHLCASRAPKTAVALSERANVCQPTSHCVGVGTLI